MTLDNNHAKLISTPLGSLSGSANITDNGFYNNQESMVLTLADDPDFAQSRIIMKDILTQATDYS